MQEYKEPSIYTPEFIPYYPDKKKKYHLTDKETLLYGFIRFYLKNSPDEQFYFSNEQLAQIMGVKNESYLSQLFNSLIKKCPEIEVSYKIKADGGKVRFVKFLNSDFRKNYSPTLEKPKGNKNKINNNKINNNKIKNIATSTEVADSSDTEINPLIDKFKNVNPAYYKLFANKTQRRALERLVKKYGAEKTGQIIDLLPITNQKQFAPIITTPLELENKLGRLIAFMKQEQNKNEREIFVAI